VRMVRGWPSLRTISLGICRVIPVNSPELGFRVSAGHCDRPPLTGTDGTLLAR
jgi:hypothetical protein